MTRLIIWGAGALGGRVGALWSGDVLGFTASTRRHAALREKGIEVQLGSPLGVLRPDDCLLLALPGHMKQWEAVKSVSAEIPPQRTVLISSTGFYGQAVQGLINEETVVGKEERAQHIAGLESDFQAWTKGRGVVLRCGGLYDAGRGPFAAFRRHQTVPNRPPDKRLALIHYDDAAAATVVALQHPQPADRYVCVTPPCPTRAEFYRAACVRLGLDAPQFPPARGLGATLYDVARLQKDLLRVPQYPDWKTIFNDATD